MEKKLDALVDKIVELFGGDSTNSIKQDIKQILKEACELGYADGSNDGYNNGYGDAIIDISKQAEC